jgi:hypothetical protein
MLNDTIGVAENGDSVYVKGNSRAIISGMTSIQREKFIMMINAPTSDGGLLMPYFKECRGVSNREVCTNKKIQQFIAGNIRFSSEFIAKKEGGKVQAKIRVNTKGRIDEITIVKTFSEEVNPFVISAIKQIPKMKPGKKNGKTVPVYFTIPINLTL